MAFHYQLASFSVVATVMLTAALLGYYAGHIRSQNQHKPVAKRLQQHGPNSLTETKEEPTWRAFLRQYKDYMRI
ncbi:MAG: cation-transporting P-type ATPase, partial [Psychrosphaera sp.]|nr:cation-transporting P-type ATPase [Psychrosphaera sp.]